MATQQKKVSIWDGKSIRQVPEDEAKRLIEDDMAQPFDGSVNPVKFKHRRDFGGYHTREMSSGEPEKPKPAKRGTRKSSRTKTSGNK